MNKKSRFKPFILSAFLVIIDQISKLWIVKNIKIGEVKYRFFNDFLWICHVRNRGAAFSMGDGFATPMRIVFLMILPLAVVGAIYVFVAKKDLSVSDFQRWMLAGIAGGGTGTMIDRFFRYKDGVVDFISVKFYGLFGLERWPTFNFSDSCVVVFTILLVLSVVFQKDGQSLKERTEKFSDSAKDGQNAKENAEKFSDSAKGGKSINNGTEKFSSDGKTSLNFVDYTKKGEN